MNTQLAKAPAEPAAPVEGSRRGSEPILSGIQQCTVKTGRETLEIHRLGIFDGWTIELVELNAGQSYPAHVHLRAQARLQVVVGTGTILLGGLAHDYRAGDVFTVLPGVSHGFRVKEQTVLLSSQDAPILDVDTGEIDLRYVDSQRS